MTNRIIAAYLFIGFYISSTVHQVSAPVALHIIQETTDHIWVFINIDIYDAPSLYTRSYKKILNYLHKSSHEQYCHAKLLLNNIMQCVHPLYSTAYGSTCHIIGITRRDLSWSHLVRATCYQQNIKEAPERYQILIPSDTPEALETNRYIELNTNILYIDDNDCARCIARYLIDAQVACHGIIYIDSDLKAAQTCVAGLQQHIAHVEIMGLYVPTELLQQKTAVIEDFNNYLEQLHIKVGQDTIEKKLKAIDDQISKHTANINSMEIACQNQ